MDRNTFSVPCMKIVLSSILFHVQHTVFKVMYLSQAMCHVTSAASSFLYVNIRIFMNSYNFYSA